MHGMIRRSRTNAGYQTGVSSRWGSAEKQGSVRCRPVTSTSVVMAYASHEDLSFGGISVFRVTWIVMLGLLVAMLIVKIAAKRADGVPVFPCKSRSEQVYVIVMGAIGAGLLVLLAIKQLR